MKTDHIIEGLLPLAVPIGRLKFDEHNARLHGERNLAAIKGSLGKFKQRKNVVALLDGTVIAGNGTLSQALALGWESLAAVFVNDDSATAKAYALADNRAGELAEWNPEALSAGLQYLAEIEFDTSAFGFSEEDLLQSLDYGVLEEGNKDLDDKMGEMAQGVRKAIQIEFEPEHYEEAMALVKLARSRGTYVGMLLIEKLKEAS